MAKATVDTGATPAEQITAKANQTIDVTDARGRIFTLKRPPVLQQFRFVEILGATSSNETYMNMVLPLLYVTAIDGEPQAPCTNKLAVEALIQLMDEDGLKAVGDAIITEWGKKDDPVADKEAIKK